jgi:hypothetical protein
MAAKLQQILINKRVPEGNMMYTTKKKKFFLQIYYEKDIFAAQSERNARHILLDSFSFTTTRKSNAHKELPRMGADFYRIYVHGLW